MNKLSLYKIFDIEINPSKLINLNTKNFYCYIYFLDSIDEKKYLIKHLKRFSKNYKFKITYKKFANKPKTKQNSTRDRIGAFYFEFDDYKEFVKLSNKFNIFL